MKELKICLYCGKTFVSRHSARKSCSKKCAYLADRKRKRNSRRFLCQWCGQVFASERRKKFCNSSCQSTYMQKIGIMRKRVVKIPVKITLEDVAKNSRAEGLTYGRYVSLKKI